MLGPPVSDCTARVVASVSGLVPLPEANVTAPVTSAMFDTGGAMGVAVPLMTVVPVPTGTLVTTALMSACPR